MGEVLLSVRDLRVGFVTPDGLVEAVRGVSLDVDAGELVGLVGESGSGKSTVVQAVLRSLGPPGVITGGQVLFDGQDLVTAGPVALRAFRWRQASVVLQSALDSLSPVRRVGDQLGDTLAAHDETLARDPGARRARCAELLALVDLDPGLLDAWPHELSGGMRQRVVLAAALALTPKLIVFDEPTTALDVLVERQILRRVLALQRELGFAVLFITHDLPLLREVVDRVAVMRDGELVEVADQAALAHGGQHPYTQTLLGSQDLAPAPRRLDRTRPPVLSVSGLSKAFRRPDGTRVDAAAGVGLQLHRGEAVALVGGSGSGKSTVAKLIARLLPADAGQVRLDGQDLLVRRPTLGDRRRVQVVFQDPYASLNPVHTLLHAVGRPLLRHGICTRDQVRDRAAALLEVVGLTPAEDFLDRHPHACSGGQRQRVAIARALACEPDVLIADEPTSMLDLTLRLGILNLLARLRDERGLALLFITHDLVSARALADRILVMQHGQVVEQGLAQDVVERPSHPYTCELVAAAAEGWSRQVEEPPP